MECDVVISFNEEAGDVPVLWLLERLRICAPQILVNVHHGLNPYLCLTAAHSSLMNGAERLGLLKPIRADLGGSLRPFTVAECALFSSSICGDTLFSSQERQTIMRHWLNDLRACHGERVAGIKFHEGQPIIPELVACRLVSQVYPLHDPPALRSLTRKWLWGIAQSQPLDDICGYFGMKIAMYFAWMSYFKSSLIYPACFGLLLWLCVDSDQTSQDIGCVAFSLFNVIWATLFLEGWKRHGAEMSYRWGTLDAPPDELKDPRPQFKGKKRMSPVTGRVEIYYPPWRRRLLRYLVSLPACVLATLTSLLAMFACFQLQEYVHTFGGPGPLCFMPKVLLALVVGLLGEAYRKVAYWLNDLENYRLESAYEKHLIVKLVLFQFVNSYSSLFYIAFYLGDLQRLKEQIAAFSLINEVARKLKAMLLPHFLFRLRLLMNFLRSHFLRHLCPPLGRRSIDNYLLLWCSAGGRRVALFILQLLGAPWLSSMGNMWEGSGADDHVDNNAENDVETMVDKCIEEEDLEKEEQGQDTATETTKTIAEPGKELSTLEDDSETAQTSGLTEGIFEEDRKCTAHEEETNNTEKFHEGFNQEELSHRFKSISSEHSEKELKRQNSNVDVISWNKGDKLEIGLQNMADSGDGDIADEEDDQWWKSKLEGAFFFQAEVEGCMKKYEDILQDHLDMMLQFGHVAFFACIFPPAAFLALLNNLLEARADTIKLCAALQRPFAEYARGIGPWQDVMEAMGVVAIIVNCALIGQGGQLTRLFPEQSRHVTLLLVVFLEHFALLLKYVIHVAIPDVPYWLVERLARLEFLRREALQKMDQERKSREMRRNAKTPISPTNSYTSM
uniref:anoctamin-8 n=1 Tax=Myxine glutinosa TaxID=7769 RepID=UPI00358F8113